MKERGFAQLLLGRFEDALESFQETEDTNPTEAMSWTWREGAGLVCLLLDRNAEAVDWLQRSLADAPGTGRSKLLLAAAYERLGRQHDAAATMDSVRPANLDIKKSLPQFCPTTPQGQSMERLHTTIGRLEAL